MIASFADIWSENIGRLSLDYRGFVGTSVQDCCSVAHFWYFLMELMTEALFLEELAKGFICKILQWWLEFPLEELIS